MRRFRIATIYKRIFNYFAAFLFFVMFFGVGYSTILKGNLKLTDLDTFTGIITNKGIIGNKSSIAGRGSMNRDIFFFKIKGLKQTLALHNVSQDYTIFDNKIKKGDIVTVYFLKSRDSLKPNLNIYQLENESEIIQHIDKHANTEIGVGYLMIIIALTTLGLSFYADRKYWKKTK